MLSTVLYFVKILKSDLRMFPREEFEKIEIITVFRDFIGIFFLEV